jgi:hypothetical protein
MKIRTFALIAISVVSWCLASYGNASLEFKRINFPEKRPRENELHSDIEVILGEDQCKVLKELLQALKDNPTIGARIVGFADKHECKAAECDALSLRRARLVFDWFLMKGIPAAQLKGPEGESTAFPLDDSDTEDGKKLNRRVQLEPYTVSGKRPGS